MKAIKQLIVNADDFGQSSGVNRGVMEAHTCGIVTSSSLMVRWPAAREAAALCADVLQLSVGLHVDLGEWKHEQGCWRPVYQVVPLDDEARVRDEMLSQLDLFRNLVGAEPTHFDSHQHVHRREPVRSVLLRIASESKAPLREHHAGIRYCGRFYGQTDEGRPLPSAISVEGLLAILSSLPSGTTELCCHPGKGADVDSMYASERDVETDTLCDARVAEAIMRHNIQLCSFHNISARLGEE